MTTIKRLQENGIRRVGTPARGFRYKHADGRKVSANDLARIEALKIPPAWTDVAISSAANGRVQAIGQDAAGRWQYLYHESHSRSQEKKKFQRLIKFAESLPKMRQAVMVDLRRPGLPRERVMACILRILATSFMRPGSDIYASENGSYGIATLRPRHVSVKGDRIIFEFLGKSGVDQHCEVRNRQVARVIKELLNRSNRRVFKYEGEDQKFVDVKSPAINQYIREVMGQKFSAKDFRTWAGTLVCACALARDGVESDGKVALKRRVFSAINETAEALGNTPAVCRDAYICPEVIRDFQRGQVINRHFETFEKLIGYRGTKLHPAERALLKLLKKSQRNHNG